MSFQIFDVNLFTGALIPALLLGIARYVFQLWGHDAQLPRSVWELLQRYMWGTASLLLGDVVWLSLVDRPLSPVEIIAGLVVIILAGGGTVALRYASDWATARTKQDPLYREMADKLERSRD